jgi:hypothetical protein
MPSACLLALWHDLAQCISIKTLTLLVYELDALQFNFVLIGGVSTCETVFFEPQADAKPRQMQAMLKYLILAFIL